MTATPAHIQLTATLSPSTLSLSSCTPSSPPIYLNLLVKLVDSPTPITILVSYSALSQRAQSFLWSYYDLISRSTGERIHQLRVSGPHNPLVRIEDPRSELLTLYPSGPAAEINLEIGPQVSSKYHERCEEGGDIKPFLAVARTQLSRLEAGDEYELGLKNWKGETPSCIWWWQRGRQVDLVRKLEARDFIVPVCGVSREKTDGILWVEMKEKPVLKVVE